MEALRLLVAGFLESLSAPNLLACALGVVVGQLVGILPGLGPPGAMAICLPLMYGRDPTQMLIMLFGIYYGAMYGGTITSVLLKTPGEASSVMTAIDGYEMARRGRAGQALGMAAFGSFIAGIVGMLGLALAANSLARLALAVGSAEYVALIIFALGLVGALGGGSVLKGLLSMLLGVALGTVGIDPTTGIPRFTLGLPALFDGIDFVIAAVGLFGLAEVLANVTAGGEVSAFTGKLSWRSLLPTRVDWLRSLPAIMRGAVIGFFVGVLPGAGASLASFFSYGAEKRLSRHPEEFGRGAIEGVAGPESANNAAACGALVPMLSLGIPGSATTAVVLSGLLAVGITPGPRIISEYPQTVWPAVASMLVGNLMLLCLNIPLIGLSVQMLKAPYPLLALAITLLSTLGVFSLHYSVFDVWVMLFFTLLGYLMKRADMPGAPLLLGLILSSLLERNLRRTLTVYGTATVLLTRPVCAAFVLATVVVWLVPPLVRQLKKVGRRGH